MAGLAEELAFDNNAIAFTLRHIIDRVVVSAHEVRPNVAMTYKPVEMTGLKSFPNETLKIGANVAASRNAIVKTHHTPSPCYRSQITIHENPMNLALALSGILVLVGPPSWRLSAGLSPNVGSP